MRSRQATISELMQSANKELSRDNPEMFFITAFAGILDVESGALDCNAGHDDPVVLTPDGRDSERLGDGAGPPLCTVERFAYQSGRRQLRPGQHDRLTDSIADAQNPGLARYGSPRLLALLARLSRPGVTAQDVVDAVRADVTSFAAGAGARRRPHRAGAAVERSARRYDLKVPRGSRLGLVAGQRTTISTRRLRGSATLSAVGTAGARLPRELACTSLAGTPNAINAARTVSARRSPSASLSWSVPTVSVCPTTSTSGTPERRPPPPAPCRRGASTRP